MKPLIWPEEIMSRSMELLNRLHTLDIPFILIGGWAVFLLTRYHMSRDVDLIMEEKELWKLRSYVLAHRGNEKAGGLSKYGYKMGGVDLDVYTEAKGEIVPSPAKILQDRMFSMVEGFDVVSPEPLLLLKIQAADARAGGLKGLKDRCDIISLLIGGKVNLGELALEAQSFGQRDALRRLEEIVQTAAGEFDYVLGRLTSARDRWKIKRKLVKDLRRSG